MFKGFVISGKIIKLCNLRGEEPLGLHLMYNIYKAWLPVTPTIKCLPNSLLT